MSGKVLYLSHKNTGSPIDMGDGYIREFLKNGVAFLDYKELYLQYGRRKTEEFITRYIKQNDIGILVFSAEGGSFNFSREFFLGLRSGVFVSMMVGDAVYYFETRDKFYAQVMDLVVVWDSYPLVRSFEALGAGSFLLPCAFDRKNYHKISPVEKTMDVSFVGCVSGRKGRMEYIEHLTKNGVEVRVFGQGSSGGMVSMAEMTGIFNRTRINLNFSDAGGTTCLTGRTRFGNEVKQLKGRIGEVSLCGSFLLSEDTPGIENLLLPGKELDIFRTKEELLEKVRFYLADEKEREAIADGGYRKAVKDFDVSRMIPAFLAELERLRASKVSRSFRSIVPDAVFERNFATYRFLYAIKFVKRFRLSLALEELVLAFKIGKIDLYQLYTFFIEEVVDKFPRIKNFIKRLFFYRTS
ncbi:MAG: hypothetical protein FD189_2312 [Elusimicrobia bacterium]|nr:MAG: hypothetical protein FD154_1114 [Elusimicrobiota bacterium]KAF0153732.1 MAG: hypothetical protein FD189_2312 [Elusimicrobiota bacterium]